MSRQELATALAEVEGSFKPGELAYLALTSKPEGAIRDRLGWALYQTRRRVAREWRERCDLAVVDDGGEPLAVVELKATYTHDVRWAWNPKIRAIAAEYGGQTTLEALIRSDAAKALRLAGTGKGYLLIVAMHVHDPVPGAMAELIAEGRKLRSVADGRAAERMLISYLRPLGTVGSGVRLGGGEAFGIRVSVKGWLCGPVRGRDQW